MNKQVDILLIIDHLSANCGVRYRYSQLVGFCNRLNINVAIISDHRPKNLNLKNPNNWLVLPINDEREGSKFKRRPFLPFSEKNETEGFVHPKKICHYHEMDYATTLWLDAWQVSNDWVDPAKNAIDQFITKKKPKCTIVATQSFLGFAATQIDLPDASVSFHTNYGAFYGLRFVNNNIPVFNEIKRAINNRILSEFFPRFSRAFLSSNNSIEEFIPYLKMFDSVSEFPGGVDIDLFKPSERKSSPLKLHLTFVGRFTEEKGIRVLTEVMSLLKNVRWSIVGQGMMKDSLVSASQDVQIFESLPQSKLATLIASSDIYISLGKWETFGMTTLEAMACGVPVVAVEGTGISSIISKSNAGIVVDACAETVVDAINFLTDNFALRKEMGRNGRELAMNMTWEKSCISFLKAHNF